MASGFALSVATLYGLLYYVCPECLRFDQPADLEPLLANTDDTHDRTSASAAAATRADPPDVDTEEKAAHVTVIASRATVHQRVKYARVRSLN